MKKTIKNFIFVLVCNICCSVGFSQIPHGSIYVDITPAFNRNIDSVLYRGFLFHKRWFYNLFELGQNNDHYEVNRNRYYDITASVLLKEGLSIYPSHGSIWYRDSLFFRYSDNTDFIMLGMLGKQYINEKEIVYFRDGWVNFAYSPNLYHITKIKKGDEEQYLYTYTWNQDFYYDDNYRKNISNISNIFYYNFEFQKGTYLINVFDKDSYVYKEFQNEEDILKYYTLIKEGLIITNEGISVNKISDEAISPEGIEHYYRNKELPRPEAVEKIMSVFKPEFDIDEFEPEPTNIKKIEN